MVTQNLFSYAGISFMKKEGGKVLVLAGDSVPGYEYKKLVYKLSPVRLPSKPRVSPV